jgi:hypothetical protein
MDRWSAGYRSLARVQSIWKAKVPSANCNFERSFALQKDIWGQSRGKNVSCGTGVVEAASGCNPATRALLPCRFRVTRRYFSRPPPQDASELRLGAGQLDIPAEEGLGLRGKLLLPSQPTYLLGSDHALSLRQRPSCLRSLVEECSRAKACGRRMPDRILFHESPT